MIRFLLITVALLLVIGPFRRHLLSAWRLVLPLAIGGGVGFFLVQSRRFIGAPGWLLWVGPVFCAFVIGGAIQEWIDDLMPPRKK